MSAVVALGERYRLEGFALAGVRLLAAGTPETVRETWDALADDVALVVLTRDAAGALGDRRWERADLLTVVVP